MKRFLRDLAILLGIVFIGSVAHIYWAHVWAFLLSIAFYIGRALGEYDSKEHDP